MTRAIRALALPASVVLLLGTVDAWAQDWPQWGGTLDRNMVSGAKGLPERFDPSEKADPKTSGVKWSVRLGSHTYGNPVIAGGRGELAVRSSRSGLPSSALSPPRRRRGRRP